MGHENFFQAKETKKDEETFFIMLICKVFYVKVFPLYKYLIKCTWKWVHNNENGFVKTHNFHTNFKILTKFRQQSR